MMHHQDTFGKYKLWFHKPLKSQTLFPVIGAVKRASRHFMSNTKSEVMFSRTVTSPQEHVKYDHTNEKWTGSTFWHRLDHALSLTRRLLGLLS